MNFQKLTGEVKRLEALVRLALAKIGAVHSTGTVGAPKVALNAAASPAATSQTFQATVTVGPSGSIIWIGTMGVTKAGGTATDGDNMLFTAVLDGAALATPVVATNELGASHGNLTVTNNTAIATGLTPSSSHTVGIQATDLTSPASTFALAGANVASVTYWSP